MPFTVPMPGRWRLALAAACVALVASAAPAQAQLVNDFGNGVLDPFKVADPDGIPGLADNRGTGGLLPNDEVPVEAGVGLGIGLGVLVDRVRNLPPTTDPDEVEEREQIIDGLLEIGGLLTTKLENGGVAPTSLAGAVTVNPTTTVAGIGNTIRAITSLAERSVLTSDAVSLSVAVVANADPFVVMHGSLTNTSETQPLNFFLPFEEAFLDPISLDAPLVREMFLSTELRDTDGDGQASLRASELQFQVLATTDPDNPSLGNTDPIGVSESLGLPRLRSPGVEFFRFADAAEVDDSLFVSNRAQVSHTTGQLILEQLSPGDTVDFTAILSLGIEGDPLTPLIPAESLRSLIRGAELVAQNAIPEPSSGLLLAGLIAGVSSLRSGRPASRASAAAPGV